MLAYVFWHRPRADTDVTGYEEAQRSFHASLEVDSACFRLTELPFASGSGYEDWYLVEDWRALGKLNAAAVDRAHAPHHSRAAVDAGEGWGGVYQLAKGEAAIPEGTKWLEKPRGEPADEFVASMPYATVWRRQLVLSPALELCAAVPVSDGREPI